MTCADSTRSEFERLSQSKGVDPEVYPQRKEYNPDDVILPSYIETERDPKELCLGAVYKHVAYGFTPYHKLTEERKRDYDRLMECIKINGIRNPIIVFRDCVLIGMRRCSIADKLSISLVKCVEITDDISNDKTPGRVIALRDRLYVDARY
jgi:hypothetical protein